MTSRINDVNKYFVRTDWQWEKDHRKIVGEKDRRIKALETTIDEMQAQLRAHQKNTCVLQEQVTLLKKQIKGKDTEIQEKDAEIKRLRQACDFIHNNVSHFTPAVNVYTVNTADGPYFYQSVSEAKQMEAQITELNRKIQDLQRANDSLQQSLDATVRKLETEQRFRQKFHDEKVNENRINYDLNRTIRELTQQNEDLKKQLKHYKNQ